MKRNITFFLLIGFLAVNLLNAKDVNSIIEKNLAARGGSKALAAINTTEAKILTSAMGMEMEMKVFSKKPSKSRMEMSVMGQNIITVYDGEKAFMSQNGNVTELPPDQTEQVKEQMKSQAGSYDNPLLDYAAKGNKVELSGVENVDGDECDVLKITTKDAKVSYLYISTGSSLDIKMKSKQNFQGTDKDVEIYFEDNKKVDGILVPHKMTIKADGEEFASMKFEYIKFNKTIEDSMFKLK
jgi:outer membrane lipoprotein-sorting protein